LLTKVKLGFATLTWRQARLKTLYHGRHGITRKL